MKYTGIELLKKLCEINAPTGREDKVAEFVRTQTEGLCEYLPDRIGNLICLVKGEENENPVKVMVSAHMDEVGFMIKSIDPDGYIKFLIDGGIDSKVLSGRSVVLFNDEHTVKGVIASKAIHSLSPAERKEALDADKLYIDIGADSEEETKNLLDVGDYGTFDSDFVLFGKNERMMKGKAIDDRLGCAVMIEIMRDLKESGKKLPFDTYFAFTTREEIGNSGALCAAQAIAPDYSIVLESTAVADIAGVPDNSKVAKLGDGGAISLMDRSTIYDRHFVDLALDTAKKNGIKAQIKKYVSGGNDAGHIHQSGSGVKTLAISAPTRYLHSACCVAAVDDYFSIKELVLAILENGKFEDKVGKR